MARLEAPQPSNENLPVFFNVDAVVGSPPASNKREDVLLVQLVFKVMGRDPTTTPALLAAVRAVEVTGTIDQATINAIRAFQQTAGPGAVVDGRVSPAKGGYSYGAALFTIVRLNNALQEKIVDIWPRIDKIPGCPLELKKMVTRTVAGT